MASSPLEALDAPPAMDVAARDGYHGDVTILELKNRRAWLGRRRPATLQGGMPEEVPAERRSGR